MANEKGTQGMTGDAVSHGGPALSAAAMIGIFVSAIRRAVGTADRCIAVRGQGWETFDFVPAVLDARRAVAALWALGSSAPPSWAWNVWTQSAQADLDIAIAVDALSLGALTRWVAGGHAMLAALSGVERRAASAGQAAHAVQEYEHNASACVPEEIQAAQDAAEDAALVAELDRKDASVLANAARRAGNDARRAVEYVELLCDLAERRGAGHGAPDSSGIGGVHVW